MSTIIHVGFDPATQRLGSCVIDGNGDPPPWWNDYHAWHLFIAKKGDVYDRLETLERAIWNYLRSDLPTYLNGVYGSNWIIGSMTIEDPSSGNGRYQHAGKSRHDTPLALGGAIHMVMRCVRRYRRRERVTFPVFETKASESSSILSLESRASKRTRNIHCARITGGHFQYDEDHPEKGIVIGGMLAGAGPDALDAYAAAHVGRAKYIDAMLCANVRAQTHGDHRNGRTVGRG